MDDSGEFASGRNIFSHPHKMWLTWYTPSKSWSQLIITKLLWYFHLQSAAWIIKKGFEMAAYGTLASLLNNIELIMIHPHISSCLDRYQIPSLREKAGLLLDFIEGNDHGGVMSKEEKDLERRIARAAHSAVDLIKSHIANQIVAGSAKLSLAIVDQIDAGSTYLTLPCLLSLQRIIEDMDAILHDANELKEKEGSRSREEEHPGISRMPLVETGEAAMVGFEEERYQLMDELISQQSDRRIISIIAMGGTGKTTLAKNVYENLTIKRHFDIRAWATVSMQHNAQDILSQLLSVQGSSSDRAVHELGEQLHRTLSGRRYLIVLDDIWGIEPWDAVRRFFPNNGTGSRVVLTSRLSNVARDCCSTSCITMKPLDEDKNWKLFCRKAFKQEHCPYPELESVGRDIARSCKGLPLSIVVIGGLLLRSPRSLQFWKNIACNVWNHNSKEKQESLDVLSLSYTHLPPHLKPCFLYMGLFKDFEIRVSKIIRLWIAEGFLRPTNNCIPEETAEGFLMELIDRNLILVRKHRKNGKIGSCGVHDLVRDLCLKVGGEHEFFHMPKDVIRGRSLKFGSGIRDSRGKRFFSRPYASNFLYNDLEYYFKLDYGRKISSSVSHMWNLQTLIVDSLWKLKDEIVAPIEFWKIRQLRHVKCYYIDLPHPPSSSNGLFMMDNLQSLATPVNLRLSEEVCRILPNIKKLCMVYKCHRQGYNDSLIECLRNLDCLHKLESLNLAFSVLLPLNTRARFPNSLKKLTLKSCELGCGDLSMIGSLPHLQVLQLMSVKFDTYEWSPIDGQFLRLKYLYMKLPYLRHWYTDKSHFPVLEKLVLTGCTELKEIPLSIGEIPTLELIRVECCSKSAAISTVRIKEDQLGNQGDDGLQVLLKIRASKVESIKETVEAEGLTLDHVQLVIDENRYLDEIMERLLKDIQLDKQKRGCF